MSTARPDLGTHQYRQDRAWVLANNDTCCLCHLPVDKTLKHPDPGSPTVEHILPANKGGAHARWNYGLAHLHCNTSKQDRVNTTPNTSRHW